jgi:glycosyltransferase involved in cell wall biosynthesis
MITVQILTKNNEKTLEATLASVRSIADQILIADLGSTDNTLSLCRRFKAKVFPYKLQGDYSKIRNDLMQYGRTEWNLFLQPWEVLVNGHEDLQGALEGSSYQVPVFQSNMLSKEIRIWRKLVFENPVFETLYDPKTKLFTNGLIYAKRADDHFEGKAPILAQWKRTAPASSQPLYYEACLHLTESRYKEFITAAERFLFYEKVGVSAVMLKYYLALVRLYHFKDAGRAIQDILACLLAKPLMAEFWCLLGDAFYQRNQYNQAIIWYENAMMLGSKRLTNDEFPMEVEKYKKYPQAMIESCRSMEEKSITLGCLTDLPPPSLGPHSGRPPVV